MVRVGTDADVVSWMLVNVEVVVEVVVELVVELVVKLADVVLIDVEVVVYAVNSGRDTDSFSVGICV